MRITKSIIVVIMIFILTIFLFNWANSCSKKESKKHIIVEHNPYSHKHIEEVCIGNYVYVRIDKKCVGE